MYCHHILANPLIALILEMQLEDFGSQVEHISDSAENNSDGRFWSDWANHSDLTD